MIRPLRHLAQAALCGLLFLSLPGHGEILVHSGDTIAFLGDSITKQGSGATGWCGLVVSSLKTVGVDAKQFNAGKGGHTSRDMLGRFEADVIARKPAWMILMCGTNDNPGHGLSLEESEKNITTIIEKTQAAGIKVLICTRPMRGGDPTENDYNAFIRNFAREKNIPLADDFDAMKAAQEAWARQNPAQPRTAPYLTIADGTHMNPRGNQVIAESVLTALGLTPEQLVQVKATWPNPDAVKPISAEEAKKDTVPEPKSP